MSAARKFNPAKHPHSPKNGQFVSTSGAVKAGKASARKMAAKPKTTKATTLSPSEIRSKRLDLAKKLQHSGYAPSAIIAEMDRQYPMTKPRRRRR